MTQRGAGSGAPIRVVLGDDHTLFREGLASLLDSYEEIEVLGSVSNGPELLALAEKKKPDIVLMEVERSIEKAKESLRRLLDICPPPQVLIVTMFEDPRYVREFLELGASAYLSKSERAEELVEVIRKATRGPAEVRDVVVGVSREAFEASAEALADALSEREMEVLLLAARGHSNRQIATSLRLSEATVSRHLANIYSRMGVSSRTEAARMAFARGWISLPDIVVD